jgi:hypothetical protein
MIGIGDDLYSKIGDNWTAMPGAGVGSDNMGTTVARTNLPKESIQDARLEGPEEVNGVSTQKYVYTAKLEDTPAMEVIAWVGIEDGLPHKIVTHSDQGTVTQMLYDFNADITITAPEIDSAAGDSGVESGAEGTNTGDMPVLEDAEEVMSMAGFTNYYTQAAIADVVDYYRQELPAMGWIENAGPAYTDESNALLNFEKDGQTLMLTVTLEDGRTSVIITTIDQ